MITAANYTQQRPDRATLTDAEQAGYDLIEAGGLEAYELDNDIREAIDLYFAELNAKSKPKPAPKAESKYDSSGRTQADRDRQTAKAKTTQAAPLIVWDSDKRKTLSRAPSDVPVADFSEGQRVEIAPARGYVIDAKQRDNEGQRGEVVRVYLNKSMWNGKAKYTWRYLVALDNGKRSGVDSIINDWWAFAWSQDQIKAAPKLNEEAAPAKPKKAARVRKGKMQTPKGRAGVPLKRKKVPMKPAKVFLTGLEMNCVLEDADGRPECVVQAQTPQYDKLTFFLTEGSDENVSRKGDDWRDQLRAAGYEYVIYAVAATDEDDLSNPHLVDGRGRANYQAARYAETYAEQVVSFYEKNLAKFKRSLELREESKAAKRARPRKQLPTPPAAPKPTAAASVNKSTKAADIKPKKPAKAKTPRARKAKPADTRTEVAHFDAELTFFRQFVGLTEKKVTQDQVRNLHRKLQKAIATRKVRKASPHAALLKLVAEKTANAYNTMVAKKVTSVDKLEFPADVVSQARTLALGSKVSNAVGLLSRFINLQGQTPEAKTVATLLKSLEKEHAEHPGSTYSMAIGAAVATLQDWKAGHAVGISAQQLGRLGQLSGLGCACQDATKGAAPMAGAARPKRATTPARKALGNVESLFTRIGEKDHRQASGTAIKLPGDLGLFLGNIEDHEYALAIRGEKGAGKTRLVYQLLDAFASIGMDGGLFSLEIAKNSDVVRRNTEAYIKPANRGRVLIASEAQSLDTIRQAARTFKVVAIDSWGKIPGLQIGDFDKIRKEFPNTLFLVIFQSTTNGTSRGGSSSEYDASAVCQVNLPGVAVMEKNRYATGAADELKYLVNEQRLATAADLIKQAA
jgi:hypothetical protein